MLEVSIQVFPQTPVSVFCQLSVFHRRTLILFTEKLCFPKLVNAQIYFTENGSIFCTHTHARVHTHTHTHVQVHTQKHTGAHTLTYMQMHAHTHTHPSCYWRPQEETINPLTSHWNGFSPVCVLLCSSRPRFWLKALVHSEHLYGFSCRVKGDRHPVSPATPRPLGLGGPGRI